jgi:hypothetical protein
LYVAAKLGIADLLHESPVSCDVLASKTGTHPESLFRTLRALASVGVFSEVAPGEFALTPSAALLQSGTPKSMRALAIMYILAAGGKWNGRNAGGSNQSSGACHLVHGVEVLREIR